MKRDPWLRFQWLLRRAFRRLHLLPASWIARPEGDVGIALMGHRGYVGGHWDEIGRLQFDYLVSEGLLPTDVLLDVGCGSLRGGVHFVPYLDPAHYLGIDKEPGLLEAGRRELGSALIERKKPQLVVSATFDFSSFTLRPSVALAQSLFTHLDRGDVLACLEEVRRFIQPQGRFYATFNEGNEAPTARRSHSHRLFGYSPQELAALGERLGWRSTYVGEFGHPRGQVMMRFDLPPSATPER